MSKFLAYRRWFLAFLIVCHTPPASAQPAQLVVGLLPTLSPRVLIKNYQPFRLYLEQALKRPVLMVTATDFTAFHKSTMAGEYDLVVTAAHLARLAQIEGRYSPLATYQSINRAMLMTSRSAPLKSAKDVKGATVATLDRFALIVSQTLVWLQEQDLQLGKDYKLLETSSHNSAAYSVLSGESALAIVSPAGLKQMPADIQEGLQVFATLPPLPPLMWLANPRMASEVPQLKSVLLTFSPALAEGKEFFDKTGYLNMREITPEEMKSLDPYIPYLKQHLGQ
ncbi:MAG: PhnD/SsuA/transferrin family substrate-binding protein [Thiobacillus sp.]